MGTYNKKGGGGEGNMEGETKAQVAEGIYWTQKLWTDEELTATLKSN
jgi:hypothetical protein